VLTFITIKPKLEMDSKVTSITLPIATVQHDFQSVITDVREGIVPSEEFWISCYKLNEPSVHGKVHAELDETDRNSVTLQSRDGVEIHGKVCDIEHDNE
jgi:hypothetical protein